LRFTTHITQTQNITTNMDVNTQKLPWLSF